LSATTPAAILIDAYLVRIAVLFVTALGENTLARVAGSDE